MKKPQTEWNELWELRHASWKLNKKVTQREIAKNNVLELRTFVLKNRVSTFWYQCYHYSNEMARREKLNWVYLTTFW